MAMFRTIQILVSKSCRNSFIGILQPLNNQIRLVNTSRFLPANEDGSGGYFQFTGIVPKDCLTIKFARSSGPGGQNVNKVNTKVEVRFHVDSADWIPDEVRIKLLHKERNRINKNGELVVTSTKFRSQQRNIEDAVAKIQDIVKEASFVPGGPSQEQQRHVKKLARRFNERRLSEKKFLSSKKRDRKGDD